MNVYLTHSRRGGIVIETIIILVVIALLVLISIPVHRGGSKDARVTQAERDIVTIAKAQERAAQSLGYYLPLQLLDNLAVSGDGLTARTDALANEPEDIRLIPSDVTDAGSPGSQPGLAQIDAATWPGPFAEIKRVYLGEAREELDLSLLSEATVRRDHPLDPWGQPYRFYSPLGIIGSRAAETDVDAFDSDEFSDGTVTTEDDRFETYAVVSYGPDGRSDSVTAVDDDIIYLFKAPADDIAEMVETES